MTAPERRITFIRHAMPQVDASEPPSAWRLTHEGTTAASALDISGTMAVSSPETKALQTTALAMAVEMEAITQDARFREVDRDEQVHDGFREARRVWVAGRLDERHRGWETPDAAARRFHNGLLAYPVEHLVIGTHGMVLTAWAVARRLIAPGGPAITFWENLSFPAAVNVSLNADGAAEFG